jgi:hypothetical protein
LADYEGEASAPGLIDWGEPLPINPAEQIAEDTFLLAQGLISKATVAEKYGIDYEAEKKLIDAEKQASNNLGGTLLRDFVAGRGLAAQPPAQNQPMPMTPQQQAQMMPNNNGGNNAPAR